MRHLYIFVLSMLAIPVSVFADDEVTHFFPEVHFTYLGEEFYVPAWDGLASNNMGARVQSTGVKTNTGGEGGEGGDENPFDPSGPGGPGSSINPSDQDEPAEYNGIIVATYAAISVSTGLPRSDFSGGSIYIDGTEYSDPASVSYQQIFGSSSYGTIHLLSQRAITGTYTVPVEVPPYNTSGLITKLNVVGIGDCAFACGGNYFKASTIIIPKEIESIGKYAFMADNNITSFQFEDLESVKVTSFSEGLLADCPALKEVTIPQQITSIGAHAFGGCNKLQTLYFYSENSPSVDENAFTKYESSTTTDVTKSKCVVWALSHQMARNYRNDENNTIWRLFAFRIPINIPASGYASFYSDQPVWGKVLNNGSWASNTKGVDVIYLGAKGSSVWKKITQNANGTFTFSQWKWSASGSTTKAIYNLGVVIYCSEVEANGEATTINLYSPAWEGNSTSDGGPWEIDPSKDLMKGGLVPVNMDDLINGHQENLYFILKNGQFVRCTGGTLAAYKAYLEIPKSYFEELGIRVDAKNLNISFDEESDDTDGINGVVTSDSDADKSWYTLQGVRVESPTRGIFIRGGKKYIMK